jgi:hypothetical protein
MRKYAGAGLIVLGISLSALGIDSGESITSRMGRLFTGWSMDWPLLLAGILSVAVGLSLTSYRKSRA